MDYYCSCAIFLDFQTNHKCLYLMLFLFLRWHHMLWWVLVDNLDIDFYAFFFIYFYYGFLHLSYLCTLLSDIYSFLLWLPSVSISSLSIYRLIYKNKIFISYIEFRLPYGHVIISVMACRK